MASPNSVTASTKVTTGSNPDGFVLGAATTDLIGFYGLATPVAKPTVTGSKGANAALTSLMTALVALGLVLDTTS
jgi:hypothetical protein